MESLLQRTPASCCSLLASYKWPAARWSWQRTSGKELLLLDTTLEAGMKTGEAALMYSFQALVS